MDSQSKKLREIKARELLNSYHEEEEAFIKELHGDIKLGEGNLTKLKKGMDKAWRRVIENIEWSRKK